MSLLPATVVQLGVGGLAGRGGRLQHIRAYGRGGDDWEDDYWDDDEEDYDEDWVRVAYARSFCWRKGQSEKGFLHPPTRVSDSFYGVHGERNNFKLFFARNLKMTFLSPFPYIYLHPTQHFLSLSLSLSLSFCVCVT